MKLMSHSDYEDSIDLPSVSDIEFRIKSRTYRQFLKQPSELWMFVACDEEGNVLEEPDFYLDNEETKKKHYLAKERCLFEGFTIKNYNTEEYDNIEAVIKYNHCYVGIKYKDEDKIRLNDISRKETIERLTSNYLQLTKTAIKQIS